MAASEAILIHAITKARVGEVASRSVTGNRFKQCECNFFSADDIQAVQFVWFYGFYGFTSSSMRVYTLHYETTKQCSSSFRS